MKWTIQDLRCTIYHIQRIPPRDSYSIHFGLQLRLNRSLRCADVDSAKEIVGVDLHVWAQFRTDLVRPIARMMHDQGLI